MSKKEITVTQAIKDIRSLMELDHEFNPEKGGEKDGKFHIMKKHLERFEVINILKEYFKDKMFKTDYGLIVDNITFVTTTFEIKKL